MTQKSVVGIQGWGSYIPRWRMPKEVIAKQMAWLLPGVGKLGNGHRSLGNWDEDALTFAVAAAQRALGKHSIDSLVFASTTAPFLDRSNSGVLADALSLGSSVANQDVGGSQRAATSAVLSALDCFSQTTLVSAGDRRGATVGSLNEFHYGDAGAAMVIGPGQGVAEYLGGSSVHVDFVDHYRTQTQTTDYALEERWVRDEGILKIVPQAIRDTFANTNLKTRDLHSLVVPFPKNHARKVCQALDVHESVLADDIGIGHCGVGQGLLMLAQVLESAEPDQLICLIGFGQGCDVLLFRTTDALASYSSSCTVNNAMGSGVEILDYLKLPVFSGQLDVHLGMRGEADKRTSMSAYYRKSASINSMTGSKCTACQTPHFPPARVCVACSALDQMEDCSFAHRPAKIKTFTEDWLAATPSPPLCYGNVEFDGGGNAFLEFTDVVPGSLSVGDELFPQFRIKDFDKQRGFRRYFWKPSPVQIIHHG